MKAASVRSLWRWCGLGGLAGAAAVWMAFGCRQADSSAANLPEVKTTVESNTAFAVDLYQRLKDQPGNLFFSPYSLSTALAMAYAGARGQTETEMARTLRFSLPSEDLHIGFGALAARVQQIQRRNHVTLVTANLLWCQQGSRFTEAFLQLIRTRYQAEAKQVDFKDAPEVARREINTWIEGKTHGKIKDAIGPSQLSPDARLLLCNAIYFKGKWAVQFDSKHTRPGRFFSSPGESLQAPMMSQKSQFKTADVGEVGLLELRYAGDDLSMIVLLPRAVDGLPELENRLDAKELGRWIAGLDQAQAAELEVLLPRFKTTQTFELPNELAALGMPSAFHAAADFSGMTGTRDLFLSDVVHQAFVEVNEEGTEAAALTRVHANTKSMTHVLRVDHPFIFLIRENRTGSVLFLGRIVDPSR